MAGYEHLAEASSLGVELKLILLLDDYQFHILDAINWLGGILADH